MKIWLIPARVWSCATAERELLNTLDWMGQPAVALVREYLKANPQKARDILAKIAQDHGIELPN